MSFCSSYAAYPGAESGVQMTTIEAHDMRMRGFWKLKRQLQMRCGNGSLKLAARTASCDEQLASNNTVEGIVTIPALLPTNKGVWCQVRGLAGQGPTAATAETHAEVEPRPVLCAAQFKKRDGPGDRRWAGSSGSGS